MEVVGVFNWEIKKNEKHNKGLPKGRRKPE